MKKFTEQINERLKLNKDTKLKKENILNIDKNDSFKCCTIKTKYASRLFFDNLSYDLVCDEKPIKGFNGKYEILFHWIGPDNSKTSKFTLYYFPNIESQFICLFDDATGNNSLFILFKDSNEAKDFIDNYESYNDEIINIIDEYVKNIK